MPALTPNQATLDAVRRARQRAALVELVEAPQSPMPRRTPIWDEPVTDRIPRQPSVPVLDENPCRTCGCSRDDHTRGYDTLTRCLRRGCDKGCERYRPTNRAGEFVWRMFVVAFWALFAFELAALVWLSVISR